MKKTKKQEDINSCKNCTYMVSIEVDEKGTKVNICDILYRKEVNLPERFIYFSTNNLPKIKCPVEQICLRYARKRKIKKHHLDIKNLFKSKVTKKNDEAYVNAIINFFKENISLPKGYKYKACALRANKKTCDLIHSKINPFLFMDISPIEDNDIPDYKICMEYSSKKEMIEKESRGDFVEELSDQLPKYRVKRATREAKKIIKRKR